MSVGQRPRVLSSERVGPVMTELQSLSANMVARALNKRGIKSATGCIWYPQTAIKLRERLERM
jgi:hypothetical protein